MEGGREGGRRWEGERARALGKEGRREGEGGAGDVGQPGEEMSKCTMYVGWLERKRQIVENGGNYPIK